MRIRFPKHHAPLAALYATIGVAAAFVAGVGAVSMSHIPNNSVTRSLQAAVALYPTTLDINASSITSPFAMLYDPSDERILFEKGTTDRLSLEHLEDALKGVSLVASSTDTWAYGDLPGFLGIATTSTPELGGATVFVAAFDVEIGHPLVAAIIRSAGKSQSADIHTLVDAARSQR